MYGAILGDMIGSPYEFDRGDKTKDFDLFSDDATFTDDTVMTVAVGEALMDVGADAADEEIEAAVRSAMLSWGEKYPDAGYGGHFAVWLKEDDPQPYNSFGNGSAMRVSAAGWLYDSLTHTQEVARATAEVTHNHPEGVKGAEAVASAIYMARTGSSKADIKAYLTETYGYDLSRTCDEIRPTYHHVESCQETVPEAVTAFLEGTDFEDVIRTAVSLGGDCDTLAAISGSIAEAFYGVPELFIWECNARLTPDLKKVVDRFEEEAFSRDAKETEDPNARNHLIVEAIDKYYEKSTKKNLAFILYVINERITEGGTFLVPVDDDNHRIQLEDEDGKRWMMCFTGEDQKNMGRSTAVVFEPIGEFLKDVLEMKNMEGVLINPWGKPFLLKRDWMKVIFSPEEVADGGTV